ncbi:hypothetical protein P8452_66369 [Trifolium repens]|nr:hypothetical protein P8452_66369 [Trifolium repens]
MDIGLFLSIFLAIQFVVAKKDRVTILGWICASDSIDVFAAPLSVVIQVVRTRNVESMPIALTVALIPSATVLLFYGFFINNIYIYLRNVIGPTLGVIQSLKKGNHRKHQVATILGRIVRMFTMTLLRLPRSHWMCHRDRLHYPKKDRVTILGWICASDSIDVFAAPLSVVVIRIRNVESMPIALTVALIPSATVLLFYGFFIKNIYIYLCNVIGPTLGVIQVIVYYYYYSHIGRQTNKIMQEAAKRFKGSDDRGAVRIRMLIESGECSKGYEELVGARGEEISSPLASAYDMSIDDDAINSGGAEDADTHGTEVYHPPPEESLHFTSAYFEK